MNELLNRKLAPEEVAYPENTLETDVHALRNRLRDNQEKFEHLSKEIKKKLKPAKKRDHEDSFLWTLLADNS